VRREVGRFQPGLASSACPLGSSATISKQKSGCTVTPDSSASVSETIASSARSWCKRPTGSAWKPETMSSSTSGPAGAEGVHRRHQPVEAGVAFDGDAHAAGRARDEPADVALGLVDQRQHRVGQAQQRWPAAPKLTGLDLRSNSAAP
jgi:hypothetical protein